MSYYAVSDYELERLRDAVWNRTGNYENTWDMLIDCLNYYCLKKGTQISMADGTTKNIEDLKYGDMLKSYDISTNQYIDVKCYGAVATGRSHSWKVHCFENGSNLWIRENHGIYCATKGWTIGSKLWQCGWEGIAEDGTNIALAVAQDVLESEVNHSYVIFTENDLYFANGILCGYSPKEKIQLWSQSLLQSCTPEEVEHFRAIGEIYDKGRNGRLMNQEYLKEAAPYFGMLERNKLIESAHQAELDATDYKNNKYAQGLLSEEEWNEFITESNAHRDAINIARENKAEAIAKIKEIQEKHGLKNRSSMKTCFLKSYKLNMEFYNKNRGIQ